MRIEELNIGDWVCYTGKCIDGIGPNRKITYIERDTRGLLIGLDYGAFHYSSAKIEDIAPIPLTPEILEKNGFARKDKYQFVNIDMLSTVEKYGTKYYDYHNIYKKGKTYRPIRVEADNIRYVHQLQHAMRLAGIDKEIEL